MGFLSFLNAIKETNTKIKAFKDGWSSLLFPDSVNNDLYVQRQEFAQLSLSALFCTRIQAFKPNVNCTRLRIKKAAKQVCGCLFL